jgi:glutaminyl-peptide cyclotransferase
MMLFALPKKSALLLALVVMMSAFSVLSVAAQSTEEPPVPTEEATLEATAEATQPAAADVELLVPEVISERPHDPNAFTQGFELIEGSIYESTGRYGESTLREVDPVTGEVIRSVSLPDQYFAEGLTLVDDHLLQLTWREGAVFSYDLATFDPLETYTGYDTEGWGICYDGEQVYTSDGSNRISVRDPETLETVHTLPILFQGQEVNMLNELECVGDEIYANVWQTDFIIRINKADGTIEAIINAAGLLTPEETATLASGATLNGIAYDAETETFLITGKLWPKVFEVQFVEFVPPSS